MVGLGVRLTCVAVLVHGGCGPATIVSAPPVSADDSSLVSDNFSLAAPFVNVQTVAVINPNGSITVTLDPAIPDVRITGSKFTSGPGDPEATARLNRIQVLVQPAPQSVLRIEALIPTDNTTTVSPDRVDFAIAIPAGAALDLTTSAGAILVIGNTAPVRARNTLGDISVTSTFGDVDIATGAGNLVLTDVTGNVAATTDNGRIDAQVSLPAFGTMTLTSGIGPINILVPTTTAAILTLNAGNGFVNANFTGFVVTNRQQVGVGNLAAILNGGGGGIIQATTNNANITFGEPAFIP